MTPTGGIEKKMKILKSRKALSPVVASIILIAVTVAVSIAVAAWMGALTVGFMGTEEIKITNMAFGGSGANIAVTINNTGTTPVTINEGWINGAKKTTFNPTLPSQIDANAGLLLNITASWTTGGNYEVKLVTSKGNQFFYTARAPSS